MKKWFIKFKRDPKGAVSLFFILITAVVFAFNAILIDYARILAVEQQTEYALQSAVRSSLAGHSSALRNYGLFGIEESEAQSIFDEVITANLEIEPDDEYFDYIQPNVEDYSLTASRPLADIDILEHQILEEMKYKAPVEIAINLIDNFSFLAEAMKTTSEFIDIAEAVQKPFENREELLDKSEDFLNGGEEREIGINDRLESFTNSMNSTDYSDYPRVNHFSDIVYHFQTYLDAPEKIEDLEEENERLQEINEELEAENEQLEEDITRLEEEIEELEEEIEDYDDDSEEELEDLEEDLEDLEDELEEAEETLAENETIIATNEATIEANETDIEREQQDLNAFKQNAESKAGELYTSADGIIEDLEEISNSIEIAKEENQKIIDAIEEAEEASNENYRDAIEIDGDTPTDTSEIDEAVEKMREDMEKVKEYPYEPEYFDQIKEPIDEALELFDGVLDSIRPVKNNIDSVTKESLDDRFSELTASGDGAKQSTTEGTDQLVDDRKDFDQDEDIEEENREEAESSNSEIFDLLTSIEDLITEDVYEELSDILATYESYAEESTGAEIDFGGDSSGSAKDAMGLLNTLFRDLGDALVNARDKLYVNEYILMYFESAKPTSPIANPDNFKFANRQVEYVVYGLHQPGANYAAALAQLFAIRFAVNFIDAFADPLVRAATHPLAVFFAALRYSLTNSLMNVNLLGTGDSVPLMENMLGVSLAFNYHDYLRLFLFMNPATDARYTRIAAVIEHDTGEKLTEQMTYVEGQASSSKELLFVPEIANMLNYTGVLPGTVEGNKFIFEREAHFSY